MRENGKSYFFIAVQRKSFIYFWYLLIKFLKILQMIKLQDF